MMRTCQFTTFWKQFNGDSEAAQSASRLVFQHGYSLAHRIQDAASDVHIGARLTFVIVVRQHYLPQQPHLISNFRILIATSIASCFSRVPVLRLSHWLDLPTNELSGFCGSIEWTLEGDLAVIPKNGDNDVKAGVVKENVELSRESCLVLASVFR